jgi:putative transposase
MSRIARVVVPGCWHHVTQRGNRQECVFLEDGDRALYLQLLRDHCKRREVRIAGYCLMTNHVHLLAIPVAADSLAKALGGAHTDYARWFNVKRTATGHVWQNRYYSCPLEERHRWNALRYVEQNPVRAGLVREALDWQWSSALAHATGLDRTGVLDLDDWRDRWTAETWRDVLDQGIDNADLLAQIRAATRTGRPIGGGDFVRNLELATGRPLRPAKRGPKIRNPPRADQLQLGIA